MGLFDTINAGGTQLLGVAWPTVWAVVRILVVSVVILLCVAYLILWERKLIGWMHVRLGPNRVGPAGLLQPIADVLKLLLKEVIQPTQASKWIYVIAPIMTVVPAFAVWAVIPFQAQAVLGDVNAGLLYVMAISSIGVYGVILAGWASNSKYAFLGAMRAAAQMVSYEISMGFALVVVLMVAGTLNMSDIVHSQQRGMFAGWGVNFLSWNWLPLLPMFVVYFISGIAETNRHPFALFFLAEYINMIVISAIATTLFLGGWDAPFGFLSFIPGVFWFVFKVFLLLSVFIWARATFPRYRYDQIMRLGWKVFLPVSVIWVVVVGFWIMSPLNIWK
jgi:NADH-quinone oxidoreductase subunit H